MDNRADTRCATDGYRCDDHEKEDAMGTTPPGTGVMQTRSLFIAAPTATTTLDQFQADFEEFKRKMEDIRADFKARTSIDCKFVSGLWIDPPSFDLQSFKDLTRASTKKKPSARKGTGRVKARKSATKRKGRRSR